MEIFEGFSFDIKSIPEQADVLTHELIGSMGSDEGMGAVVADAKKRFLKPNALFIPLSCKTVIAPVIWENKTSFFYYIFRILRFLKKPWNPFRNDYHLIKNIFMVWNLPEKNLIHPPLDYEVINFSENYLLEESKDIAFKINNKTKFNGFYIWSIITVDKDNIINCFNGTTWPAIYIQISKEGIELFPGDEIIFKSYRNIIKNPFYNSEVFIIRDNKKIEFGEFQFG